MPHMQRHQLAGPFFEFAIHQSAGQVQRAATGPAAGTIQNGFGQIRIIFRRRGFMLTASDLFQSSTATTFPEVDFRIVLFIRRQGVLQESIQQLFESRAVHGSFIPALGVSAS